MWGFPAIGYVSGCDDWGSIIFFTVAIVGASIVSGAGGACSIQVTIAIVGAFVICYTITSTSFNHSAFLRGKEIFLDFGQEVME